MKRKPAQTEEKKPVITGFAASNNLYCPSCNGQNLQWLATWGQPPPDPLECRCVDCGHNWLKKGSTTAGKPKGN